MPQADLAERIGRSEAMVNHWIKGRRRPSASDVDRICEVFGLEESDDVALELSLAAGLTYVPPDLRGPFAAALDQFYQLKQSTTIAIERAQRLAESSEE